MSAANTVEDTPPCDVEACPDPFHARLGRGGPPYCSKHYQQARRHERGEGRAPGEVKQIAKPGEGDQVSFKLDKTRKDKIADLAASEGVDASDLYREAVDLLLAQRQARREAAAKFLQRVEGSALFQRFEKSGDRARITDNDLCDLFAVTLETSPEVLRARVEHARELLAMGKRKAPQRFVEWVASWLDSHAWSLIKAA